MNSLDLDTLRISDTLKIGDSDECIIYGCVTGYLKLFDKLYYFGGQNELNVPKALPPGANYVPRSYFLANNPDDDPVYFTHLGMSPPDNSVSLPSGSVINRIIFSNSGNVIDIEKPPSYMVIPNISLNVYDPTALALDPLNTLGSTGAGIPANQFFSGTVINPILNARFVNFATINGLGVDKTSGAMTAPSQLIGEPGLYSGGFPGANPTMGTSSQTGQNTPKYFLVELSDLTNRGLNNAGGNPMGYPNWGSNPLTNVTNKDLKGGPIRVDIEYMQILNRPDPGP